VPQVSRDLIRVLKSLGLCFKAHTHTHTRTHTKHTHRERAPRVLLCCPDAHTQLVCLPGQALGLIKQLLILETIKHKAKEDSVEMMAVIPIQDSRESASEKASLKGAATLLVAGCASLEHIQKDIGSGKNEGVMYYLVSCCKGHAGYVQCMSMQEFAMCEGRLKRTSGKVKPI